MKKYLYSALALPLLFACSSEDFNEQVVSNDQFAGIEKVDATFSMDEGTTRFDKGDGSWSTEEGDLWGFSWMGDGTVITVDGKAYQNHNLIQTSGIFTPQTSIYVGKYYIYRPYDFTTVSPQAINFTSLENQVLRDGMNGAPFKNLGKTAINIGDKWTNVTTTGTTDLSGKTWNKAGIKEHYEIYAAMFSNQTGLDLTYKKNNVAFDGTKTIQGATDIKFKPANGTKVGAADIYKVEVELAGQSKSFTYAPTKEPNTGDHDGNFWADKKGLPTAGQDGFTFAAGAITLDAPTADGVSTDTEGNKGWFWFNSLPNKLGTATLASNVTTVLETSYGTVTVVEDLDGNAYAYAKPTGAASESYEWIKLVSGADDLTKAKDKKEWKFASHNTFVNNYGNHKGKYALDVDFSDGVMDGMDIKNDAHLQKALKYYIASGKTETVVLDLLPASASDNTFKISKISIALLQTIGAKALVNPGTVKVIVTQDGQAELSLADKKEVPTLNSVFSTATDVYLSKDCEWTWGGDYDGDDDDNDALTTDANVSSLTNEGTLTVNASNIELSAGGALANAADATMNITKVTTVKTALTNLGTINVGAAGKTSPELRAYGVAITNDATALNACGTINNYGVVGTTAGVPGGAVNNYGLIDMKSPSAITLLKTNELVSDFDNHFAAATNKMGTVILPDGQPNALVSVSNGAETGFIKYNWDPDTKTYATPNSGTVKYNTIVVSGDIKFTATEPEVQYIEFNGTRTQVTNPSGDNKLTQLKGIMINDGKSIIIEKGNSIVCANGAFLGAGATVYKGGVFTHNAAVVGTTASNYFGDWQTTQVVEW